MRWRILWLVPLAVFISGCKPEPTSAIVDRRTVEGVMVLAGELVTPPTDYANVLAPYNAPVDKVMVTEGKWVREGQVLMTLSFPNLQAGVQQAKENLKAAQTSYANARSSFDDEVKRIDAEMTALKSLQAQGEDVTD